jgi:hypothetical protein
MEASVMTRKQINLVPVLVAFFLILIAMTTCAGNKVTATTKPEKVAIGQGYQQERTFKLQDFKDSPLAIREVRNLQSDTWYKDLEIEVKNISSKRIYFIFAFLLFPDVPVGNSEAGVHLEFGERKNLDYHRTPESEDSYVDPGKTVVLKIAQQYTRGLQFQQEHTPETTKRLQFRIAEIRFGDGTGFTAQRFEDCRFAPRCK